jgi:hypothetical protein
MHNAAMPNRRLTVLVSLATAGAEMPMAWSDKDGRRRLPVIVQ